MSSKTSNRRKPTPTRYRVVTLHGRRGARAFVLAAHRGGEPVEELEISRRLFEERATLTATDVARLVRQLEDVMLRSV